MNDFQSVMLGLNLYLEALDLSEEVGEDACQAVKCGQPEENSNTTSSQLSRRLHSSTRRGTARKHLSKEGKDAGPRHAQK